MKNLKYYILYPLIVLLITSIVYAFQLLVSNFTPRMYFYPQHLTELESTHTIKRYKVYSEENFLGIVTLTQPIQVNILQVSDILFRIKEEKQQDWIIENRYSSSDLNNAQKYSIGFPVQNSSEDKIYIIEFEAKCNKTNACSFSPNMQEVVLRHYFSKSFYIQQPFKAISIVFQKIYHNYIQHPWYKNVAIQLIPLSVYYVIFLSGEKRIVKIRRKIIAKLRALYHKSDLIIFGLIVGDTIIQSTILFYLILVSVLFVLYKTRKPTTLSMLIISSAGFYLLSLISTLIGIQYLATRISVWAAVFIFSVIAVLTLRLYKKR